jgi:CubicO group peptidase (beta-lactamase class C family)
MKRNMGRLLVLMAFLAPRVAGAEEVNPGKHWDHSTEGWSPERLLLAKAEADRIKSSAVLVVQHGKVVADWGETSRPIYLHSVRKSLLSSLYGIAADRKKVDLEETLASLDIDDKPPSLTDGEKQARVIDLLKARSGVYHKAADEPPDMQKNRPARGSHPHDTFWFYNNWDFNALGTIFQMKTGTGVFDAFERDIAGPLQMEDFHPADCFYASIRESLYPAYRMSLSARDLSRFGLLYLHNGKWNGKQIVPANWVRDSLKAWSPASPGIGYGYLWWIGTGNMEFKTVIGRGSFSARGVGGQILLVAPELDLVLAHLYDTNKPGAGDTTAEFGGLLHLILDARTGKPETPLD